MRIIAALLIIVGLIGMIVSAVLPVVGVPGIIGSFVSLLAGVGFLWMVRCNRCD